MMVERALEAWVACNPTVCTMLPEKQVLDLLPCIAVYVPGGRDTAQKGKRLQEAFTPMNATDRPLFLQMLKTHGGQVQFFYFWRAFSEVSRLIAAVDGTTFDESLTCELEALRDRVLRLLESGSGALGDGHELGKRITAKQLRKAIRRTEAGSSEPHFWRYVSDSLDEAVSEVNLEQLTLAMLCWLREAAVWGADGGTVVASLSPSVKMGSSPNAVARELFSVRLNIYDCLQDRRICQINSVFAHQLSPLKFGGVFHAGVEINGWEWQFGSERTRTSPGVKCVKPRSNPQHTFRQTVRLPHTTLSAREISSVLTDLTKEYPAETYDLLRRNCCHFADDLCQRLGVGHIPGWVYRLANFGARIDNMLQAVTGTSFMDA